MVGGLPEPLIAMLPLYGTLLQGGWNASETFEYRYEFNDDEGLFACIARLRQGLFVVGFAVESVAGLVDAADWARPDDPSTLLKLSRFERKNGDVRSA